jgi:hypothetical protein
MHATLWFLPWVMLWAAPLTAGGAGSARIIKVLPHYLDLKGRHSLSPSLYERDAYQAYLREHPRERSGLRFDIQWKARRLAGPGLSLRLELRGTKSHTIAPLALEKAVRPGRWFSRWSNLVLDEAPYRELGAIIAWRVTLTREDRVLAEQRSFLW